MTNRIDIAQDITPAMPALVFDDQAYETPIAIVIEAPEVQDGDTAPIDRPQILAKRRRRRTRLGNRH
ncbi:MAG: hypothetical protein AAFR51_08330 [Pseudomonadota bacterium]